MEWFLVEVEREVVFIKAKGAEGKDDGAGSCLISFEDGLNPEDELLGAEGLCQIIIDARFQAADSVVDLTLGGQHQDRNLIGPGVSLHFLQDGKAVHAGEHEVEDNEIGLFLEDFLKALPSVVHHINGVAYPLKVKGNQRGDIDFIFDDQNFVTHWFEVNSKTGVFCHCVSVTILSLRVEDSVEDQILGAQPSR